jgi:hypothetical protein
MVPEALVLDSGPLQDFFLACYERETGNRWWDRAHQLQCIRTEDDWGVLSSLLRQSCGRIHTSAGVVAEMQMCFRRVEKHELARSSGFVRQIWGTVQHQFREWRLVERSVRLVDMNLEDVVQLGPVDVGLIGLARQIVSEGRHVIVLTNDRDLRGLCQRQEIRAEFARDAIERHRAEK